MRRVFVTLTLALCTVTWAADAPSRRAREFSRLPDWSGYWEPGLSSASVGVSGYPDDPKNDLVRTSPLMQTPPYNAEWMQRYQAVQRAVAAGPRIAAKQCDWRAFPMIMGAPGTFQVVSLPEETLMIFDKSAVRHIFTDGRNHPSAENVWPTRMGHSIGRWEGDTLVIDTISRSEGPVFVGPSPTLGERAHFVERIRKIDADTLENRMTIADPERLEKPWELTFRYRRVHGLDRMIEWDCEFDQHVIVDGKLQLAP